MNRRMTRLIGALLALAYVGALVLCWLISSRASPHTACICAMLFGTLIGVLGTILWSETD